MFNSKDKNQSSTPQFKTLSPLLRFFIGLELRVELKNGKSYHGFLYDSDDNMNITLSTTNGDVNSNTSVEAIVETLSIEQLYQIDRQLGEFQFSKLHVRGSAIRYIQFPDNADLPLLIKLGVDRKRAAKDKYARGKRQKR